MPLKQRALTQKGFSDLTEHIANGSEAPRNADTIRLASLSELNDGQEADFFALLSDKQELTTRDGKPYYRVTFRDARREVGFPIWCDSAHAESCKSEWTPGQFYKLRAVLRQSNYGPQLEIKKIRPVEEADHKDGFHPSM